MANKKLKLLYLADFLRQHTDEQHPKTVQDMITHLAAYDISAERKSIYDDLHLLELYGMDIQTVKAKNFGYFLGERDFQLPELKMLIDVVQASPFLTQSKSMELITKLEQLTSRYGAKQLRRQVYVMNRVRTPNEALYYAVDGIHTAISENKKISFRYFDYAVDGTKRYRRGGESYVANPVALCVDRHYYLVAYDTQLQNYRHYRVDRISHLNVLEETRDPLPRDFDLGEYTKTIFSMYNGETTAIRLQFEEKLLNVMRDRFGSSAHMHTAGEGLVEVSAQVELGPTFYGWLFQFGTQAKLLAPQAAVEDYKTWCRDTLAQYE